MGAIKIHQKKMRDSSYFCNYKIYYPSKTTQNK